MKRFYEEKRLIPVTIKMQDNVWDISSTEEGYMHFNCKTTTEKMRNLLYKIKAKDGDGINHCSSSKNDTYMGMLKDIDNKGQVTINVWKSKYPKSKEEFESLFN